MRNFFWILLLFSQSALALEWPEDLYRINGLNFAFYGPLKSYMSQVIDTFPVEFTPSRITIYDKHHHHETLLEIDFFETTNGAIFLYRTPKAQMTMQIEGDLNQQNMKSIALFDLSALLVKDSFTIHFLELNYSMRKIREENGVKMEYRPNWGRVYLRETETPDELLSRLWFICAQCSGEPLIFSGTTEGEYFYQGKLVNLVSPQTFLQVANQWYLSSISRQSITLLRQVKGRIGFPQLPE